MLSAKFGHTSGANHCRPRLQSAGGAFCLLGLPLTVHGGSKLNISLQAWPRLSHIYIYIQIIIIINGYIIHGYIIDISMIYHQYSLMDIISTCESTYWPAPKTHPLTPKIEKVTIRMAGVGAIYRVPSHLNVPTPRIFVGVGFLRLSYGLSWL